MFPSDFDIFSASVSTIPLCIQSRAKGRPAASDWAISFSWWGKTRSEPPPWIAKAAPSSCSAITEHSMCQPGRPGPQGESQLRVLALLVRLPEREVERVLLQRGRARLLALVHVLGAAVGELAVAVEAADPEVDVAARLVGVAATRPARRSGRRSRRSSRSPAARRRAGRARAGRCPRSRRGSSPPRTRPRASPPPAAA